MEPTKVVLRYIDGAVLKGYLRSLHPHHLTFHFQADDEGIFDQEMGIDGLKALFLVKSFEGDSSYRERKRFAEEDTSYGNKAEVIFGDGEIMQGWISGYLQEQPGFFLRPADPKSNNILVLAPSAAVKGLRRI
jgi:Family of unknown function (DUF6982)